VSADDTLPPVDYTFHAEAEGSPWLLREIEIHEELSGEYQATIDLENDDPLADADALLGAGATVTLARPTPEPLERRWGGVVRAVDEPWGTDLAGRRRCRILVEPAFACLKEERLTRKFQDMTVPDVLRTVLRAFSQRFQREHELRLAREAEPPESGRAYAVRDLCVQYDETTFDFLRRLMSEEGLTYLFEHGDGHERLVIIDGNRELPVAAEPYPLRAPGGWAAAREAVRSLALSHGRCAALAEARTFNLTQHRTITETRAREDDGFPGRGGAELALPGAAVTLFGYQDGAYRCDDAAPQARLALERGAAAAAAGRGTSDVIGFRPGLVFELEPGDGPPGKLLLTGVRHRGGNPERLPDGTERARPYANELAFVPADLPFRPALLPKPVAIEDTALVVSGIEGDPIHTDVHGRVRVRFGYDGEDGVPAERRSPWIPVSQAWAGAGYGVQIIPRAGMLVRLRYLYGDPDRPLVVGCLPTATNVLPSRPPEEKSRLTIRTRSLRDGGDDAVHANEITLDDAAGHEEVFIRAGRNYRRRVLHDERVHVEHDEHRLVGHDQTLEVKGMRAKTVGGDESIVVEGGRTTLVQGDDTRQVAGCDTLTVGGDQAVAIAGARSAAVGGMDSGTFLGGREELVTGDDRLHVSRTLTAIADREWRATQGPTDLVLKDGDALLRAGGAIKLEVKGARLEMEAGGVAVLQCEQKISLVCGAASITLTPDEITIVAPEVQLTGANGAVRLDRTGATTSGLNVTSAATATNQITGAFVKAN
jgi:type VI secretion system secreted protein VgrG